MPVFARNIYGTSKENASTGKLKRWKDYFGISGPKCSEAACLESDNLLGAPIEILEGRNKGKKYIIPLCNPLYKQHGEEFYIKDTIKCMPLEELQR